jgi:hypothetical protein
MNVICGGVESAFISIKQENPKSPRSSADDVAKKK